MLSNVPNADRKGQPNEGAREDFPPFGPHSPDPAALGPFPSRDARRVSGRLVGTLGRGVTAARQVLALLVEVRILAPQLREASAVRSRSETESDEEPDQDHRQAHAEQGERLTDFAPEPVVVGSPHTNLIPGCRSFHTDVGHTKVSGRSART